jgi:hypothetical protein
MLGMIVGLSVIMWYVIDRFKELWEGRAYSKYITVAISAAFASTVAIGFSLDLVFALDLVEEASAVGTAITALVLMSGSSAVSEIIGRVKGE